MGECDELDDDDNEMDFILHDEPMILVNVKDKKKKDINEPEKPERT